MAFAATEVASTELLTSHIELRATRRTDLDALHEAIVETLPALVRWLPWARPGHDRLDTRRYLRSARSAWNRRTAFEFVLETRDDGALLGAVSLHRIDWLRRCAGLGYWIRSSRQGQGLATEAVGALIDHAFDTLRMHRLEVLIALDNSASQRVAAKLGFSREGVAREVELVNGRYLDHVQYGLLRSDPPRPTPEPR